MRTNAKDYIFQQISSAITMAQESASLPNYWCPVDVCQQFVEKLNWMLTEAAGVQVQIMTDAVNPDQSYQIKVGEEIMTVNATFTLIDTDDKSDAASLLHDILTATFPRITPKNLQGFDEVYQEFIDNWTEHRRREALRAAGFDN